MDLGEAIYREITGKSPRTEITSFGDAVRYLVGLHGSASAAGRAIGVAPSSFRHWATGARRPKPDRAGMVLNAALQAQRRARLSPGRERRMRRPGALDSLRLKGNLMYDGNPEGDRDIDLGTYIGEDVQGEILDAYLDGANTEELAGLLTGAITDDFYQGILTGDNDSAMWFAVEQIDGWR